MLSLPPSVRVFVATQPVDGRKGVDSLTAIVRSALGQDPLSGHLYVSSPGGATAYASCTGTAAALRCGPTNRLHTTPPSVPDEDLGPRSVTHGSPPLGR
jgi:hypothetical protein